MYIWTFLYSPFFYEITAIKKIIQITFYYSKTVEFVFL